MTGITFGRQTVMCTSLLGVFYRKQDYENWWDCDKNDMESLGLSKRMHSSGIKWRRRIKGATG